VKDRVQSIGCSGGDDPTREEQQLTAINKYDGPDNFECSTMPQQGRSGGGLFLGNDLIGVCIAADPKEKRGIYSAIKPIASLLEKVGLGHLAPTPLAVEGALAATNNTESGNTAQPNTGNPTSGGRDSSASASLFSRALGGERSANIGHEPKAVSTNDDISRLLANELAGVGGALAATPGSDAAMSSQDYEGAEVICIVRSKTPGMPSRVVIVNQASGRFVGDLLYEAQAPADRTVTRRAEKNAGLEVASQASVAQQRVRRPSPLAQSTIAHSVTSLTTKTPSVVTTSHRNQPIETSFEPQPYRRQRD
jgi:hypothetical protein